MRRAHRSGARLGIIVGLSLVSLLGAAKAESLPEALAKAYQHNPQLNAQRARQRL